MKQHKRNSLVLITVSLVCLYAVLPAWIHAEENRRSKAPVVSAALTLGMPYLPLLILNKSSTTSQQRLMLSLSSLSNGAGYLYLGEYQKAAVASGLRLVLGEIMFQFMITYPNNFELPQIDDPTYLSILTWQDMNYYTAYAAYREARIKTLNRGFKTPCQKAGFTDYLKAPFQKRYVGKKSSLIPLGILTVFATLDYLSFKEERPNWVFSGDKKVWLFRDYRRGGGALALSGVRNGVMSMNAGLSEEALFRGVFQTELTEITGHPMLGLAGASALFGLAHWDSSLPRDLNRQGIYTRSLIGAYLGWLYMRNNYKLEQSIAVHFWWDMIIFTSTFLKSPDDFYGMLGFSQSVSMIF